MRGGVLRTNRKIKGSIFQNFSNNSPSILSIRSRNLQFSKEFLIPRSNSRIYFSRRNVFSVLSSLVDNDAESSESPARDDIKTSTWKWRGYSIRYQYSGSSRPALVLVHGFGAKSDHWRKNFLLAQSHRVYGIDLIGYGYSDKPNPQELQVKNFYTFEMWASQLNDFCTEIVKDDEVFFVCNSIGGVVGLQAAVIDPAICKGIIVLNISLRMLHIKKQPWNTARGKFFFKVVATPESVRNILCQCYYDTSQVTDESVKIILEPGLDPGAADVFLKFICYSVGPFPRNYCLNVLYWLLGRAYAQFDSVEDFVVLPNVGHCPQDEGPQLINPLIASFVARHESRPANK